MKKIFFLLFLSHGFVGAVAKLYHQEHPYQIQVAITLEEKKLIDFLRNAIDCSQRFESKIIDRNMLFFGGHMTSPQSRHVLNNICSLPDARYLEIGTHKGASLISALYKNNVTYGYAIDNWAEFGNCRAELLNNIAQYIPNYPLVFIEKDSFSIDVTRLPKFNIYFYDGGHSVIDQEKAFTYFNTCFDDLFIAIVDDWMWEQVRVGTYKAFNALNYNILFEKEVALRFKEDVPWRFLYVCIIRKNNKK